MSKEKKLSKDELADFVTNLQLRYPKAFFHTKKLLKRANQAFGQLKQLIEAQAEPSKEWREEKAKELLAFMYSSRGSEPDLVLHKKHGEKAKDFIRNLVGELSMRKPKVSKKWMSDFTHDVFVFDPSEKYTLYDFLKDKFEEAGMKMEK